ERGIGVFFQGRELQAKGLLGAGKGQAVDLGGGLGELARAGAELLVDVLVHGGFLLMVRQGLPVCAMQHNPSDVAVQQPSVGTFSYGRQAPGSGTRRYRSHAPPPPKAAATPAATGPRSTSPAARWS